MKNRGLDSGMADGTHFHLCLAGKNSNIEVMVT